MKAKQVWVSRAIDKLYEIHQIPYEEMMILYRVKRSSQNNNIGVMKTKLKEANIPFHWMAEDQYAKSQFSKLEPTVKISTLESSKGLDFQAVFIVNTDNMPFSMVRCAKQPFSTSA